jgi:hypothetical protein
VVTVAGEEGGVGGTGPGRAGTAWYRKWWVWTIAACIAAGAGLGAYFGTRESPFNPPAVHVPTQ